MRLRVGKLVLASFWLAACSSSTTQGGPNGGPTGTPPGDADAPQGDTTPVVIIPEDVGPDWLRGEHPDDLPAALFVIGSYLHEDPGEAKARAELALAAAVWGPIDQRPGYRPLPPAFVEGEGATKEVKIDDGRTAVLVATKREVMLTRIQDWLDDAAADMLASNVPDEPRARVVAAIAAMKNRALEEFVCARTSALTKRKCRPAGQGDDPFTVLATALLLRPALEGGVPRIKGEAPLRPAAVVTRWKKADGELIPWTKVPLIFEAPEGVLTGAGATTNNEGYAEMKFTSVPSGDVIIRVTLDREKLFGDFAADWKGEDAVLRLRTITEMTARVAVYLFEHISQEPNEDGTTAKATVAGLKAAGYNNARVVSKDLAASLESARTGAFRNAVRKLADVGQGHADIIVIGEVHSDYASHAIGRSVWHEAIVNAKVYDVWTGKHLGDIEKISKAKGVGEYNAARKAMRGLGTELAKALHELFTTGKANALSAPGPERFTRLADR